MKLDQHILYNIVVLLQDYLCNREESLKPFYLKATTKLCLSDSPRPVSMTNDQPSGYSGPVHWTIVRVVGVPFTSESPWMAPGVLLYIAWGAVGSWLWKEWTSLPDTCSFSESHVVRCKINRPRVVCFAICELEIMWVYHWDAFILSLLPPSKFWTWQAKNQSLESWNVAKEINAKLWGL